MVRRRRFGCVVGDDGHGVWQQAGAARAEEPLGPASTSIVSGISIGGYGYESVFFGAISSAVGMAVVAAPRIGVVLRHRRKPRINRLRVGPVRRHHSPGRIRIGLDIW
jgi:hypothetical protein